VATGPAYPVNLLLQGRRCLVVGGGHVALRKAQGRALDVEVIERAYAREDVDGCWLVITATGVPEVDADVQRDAEDAGIFVNAADDPVHCSFTLPAVHRRGDLVVTVSTAGRSPAMASWLRDELAAGLGPEHDALLELLANERDRLRAEGVATMLEDLRNGRIVAAKERLRACLSSSSD
jgi:siroheme synthase-like protein